MAHILVTGSNGQLGSELRKLSVHYTSWDFTFTDVDNLDITDAKSVESLCRKEHFDFIVNCAAYTAVDKAESDPEKAFTLNCGAVKNLVSAASGIKAVFIHVSTDYVFDGNSPEPYTEDHPVSPQSVYGRTKNEGEQEALKYDRTIIVRTAWLYSTFGNNFVKTMLRLGSERNALGVVFDQVGSPTYAEDLAGAILTIIDQTQKQGINPGIYHYSNEGVCSWYDFAWEIMNYTQMECLVSPIETKDFPSPVKRPSFSVFNKSKIKKTYNINIPYWKTSLYKCLNELK